MSQPHNSDLVRPSDFIRQAQRKGASTRPGHGSRVIVRYQGKTIGFSNHGDKPYSRPYRHILIKAFAAAGLLALLIGLPLWMN